MDANVTSPSEPDHDNSSLQNPSTNPAEAGTTDETRDEEHETSSIEALNWSEVEEEELAAAQQAEALAAVATLGKLASETKTNNKGDKEDDNVTNNGSSNDEGSVLSTTLLQSINSSISDEDPQARKLSVIENWASEVTNAVERGEIELTEDFPDENGVTGDDEEEIDEESRGLRKRKGKKLSPDMVASVLGSASTGESNVDPLSNAPVLDDGPIWNKGPRSYTFQENRRMNQKLTFCLLIAVVLAVGLGLGNLVAHQECEAEFKASQQSQVKLNEKSPVHAVPTTTTPAPIIPDRSTDSSMMSSSLPKQHKPNVYMESHVPNEEFVDRKSDIHRMDTENQENKRQGPGNTERRRKLDEPVIDPKYKIHAETVSSVVHTLDRLSREIDQFENTTRKLQGVLMIPDEEKTPDTSSETVSSLFDQEVHTVDEGDIIKNDKPEEDVDEDAENEEDENARIDDLIDAIEQTPDYLEMRMHEKRLKELDAIDRPRTKFFSKDPEGQPLEVESEFDKIISTVKQFQEFERRFIKKERKLLKDEGKYDRLSWRLPEEYTSEEKKALGVRYNTNWREFLKLMKSKVPDPIETLFGPEDDEEERTLNELLYYPFPDPDADYTEEEFEEIFKGNLKEWDKNIRIGGNEKSLEESDQGEKDVDENPSNIPLTAISAEKDQSEETSLLEGDDDLIITEVREEQIESLDPKSMTSGDVDKTTHPEQASSASKSIVGNGNNAEQKNIKLKEPRPRMEPNDSPSASPIDRKAALEGSPNQIRKVNAGKKEWQSKDILKPKPSTKPENESTHKNRKGDHEQREGKYKQGKRKVHNRDADFNASIGGESPKFRKDSSKDNMKLSNKGKKLKNLESNKIFENIKGKMVDKRRGASPETQRNTNFGGDTKHNDVKNGKYEKNNVQYKKSSSEDNKKDELRESYGDSFEENNYKQKSKQFNENKKDNYNGREHKYKDHASSDLKQNGNTNNIKSKKQERYEKRNERSKSDFSGEKQFGTRMENQDSYVKESEIQQKKTESKSKQNYHNHLSENNQNGKRSKNWQSKEKPSQREKLRENGSTWSN